MAAEAKTICCTGLDLASEEQGPGLVCEIGDKTVAATYSGGSVHCSAPEVGRGPGRHRLQGAKVPRLPQLAPKQGGAARDTLVPPQGPAPDVEQAGLRLRVRTGKGTLVHDGLLGEPASAPPDQAALGLEGTMAPERKQTFRERYSSLKPFAIISCSYLLFTITDGGGCSWGGEGWSCGGGVRRQRLPAPGLQSPDTHTHAHAHTPRPAPQAPCG